MADSPSRDGALRSLAPFLFSSSFSSPLFFSLNIEPDAHFSFSSCYSCSSGASRPMRTSPDLSMSGVTGFALGTLTVQLGDATDSDADGCYRADSSFTTARDPVALA
jgi:hypothetical protein